MTCLAKSEPSSRPISSKTAKQAAHADLLSSKCRRRQRAKQPFQRLTAKKSTAANSKSTKLSRKKNAAALAAEVAVDAVVVAAVAATAAAAVVDTAAADATNSHTNHERCPGHKIGAFVYLNAVDAETC